MSENQFKESAEELKNKKKYIDGEQILAKETGLSISITSDMSIKQMHEILTKELTSIIKDPRFVCVPGWGQAAFTGICRRNRYGEITEMVVDVCTRDPRCPNETWFRLGRGYYLEFVEPSIIELTLQKEKEQESRTPEEKNLCDLVGRYSDIIEKVFNSLYPDVLPDLQMKIGMDAEKMKNIFSEKLKKIAEKPETILSLREGCLRFGRNDSEQDFFVIVIDKNNKNYGRVLAPKGFLMQKVADVFDKQLADYFAKEYDRLSKIERLPKLKPNYQNLKPEPKPKKKEGLLDKFIGFFKGNSKS